MSLFPAPKSRSRIVMVLVAALLLLGFAGCCGPWSSVGREVYSDQCKLGAQRCDGLQRQVCERGGSGKAPDPFATWRAHEECSGGKMCKVRGGKAVCVARP